MNDEVSNIQCYACATRWHVLYPVGRGEECHKCRRDARCCKNCFFYSPSFHNHCREVSADPVADKEKSNFCSFFEPSLSDKSGPNPQEDAHKSKQALGALFGETKTPSDSSNSTASELEKLFKK